jgi:hypothetical protein
MRIFLSFLVLIIATSKACYFPTNIQNILVKIEIDGYAIRAMKVDPSYQLSYLRDCLYEDLDDNYFFFG